MTYNDIIGSVGVWLILFAYFLNTAGLIKKDKRSFYVLNIIGAALACPEKL